MNPRKIPGSVGISIPGLLAMPLTLKVLVTMYIQMAVSSTIGS